jgi:hypothetical protein
VSGVVSVFIRYSTDGGVSYPNFVAAPAPADSEYAWTVPVDHTTTARVRVIAVDDAGHVGQDGSDADFTLTTASDVEAMAPVTRTWLEPPAPNPFNPSTVIRYSILETGPVRLAVYDVHGRRVRSLVNAVQPGPRWYGHTWDGRDEVGRPSASGVYLVELQAPGAAFTRRIVLLK